MAANHSVWRGQVISCCNKLHNMSQQQIALCLLENFCANLGLCNIILLPQQVSQILADLILWLVAKSNIFTKILQYTWSDLSPQLLSSSVFWPCPSSAIFLQCKLLILKYWSQLLLCIDLSLQEQEEKYQFTEEEVFSHAYLNIKKEHYFCGKVFSTKNLLQGSPQGSRTRNFPWLVWACPPGYFHRKHRGNKTKRILQLFKS